MLIFIQGQRTKKSGGAEPRTENQELSGDEETRRQGDKESFWVAKGRLTNLQSTIYNLQFEVVEERLGADLVGWRYAGPFDELAAQQGVEHRVVPWEDVSEDEGTDVVHIAPGAAKEDFALGRAHGLAVLAPLDDDGVYVAGYGWLSGRKAADVAEEVAAELERKHLQFDREQYTHRYPVCWRCGTELLFRLTDEWSIRMDELRGQLNVKAVELLDSSATLLSYRSETLAETLTLGVPSADAYAESAMLDGVSLTVGVARR